MSTGIRSVFRTLSDHETQTPTMDELFAAVCERFPEGAYHVTRDDRTSTVWVALPDHHKQVGIQPHTAGRRGLEAALESVDEKFSA